jgi:hypothetical protein
MVTFAPANPSATNPGNARSTSEGSTGSGTYTQSIPSARNAALWIRGERLWATGHPMMPTVRV